MFVQMTGRCAPAATLWLIVTKSPN